MIIKGYDQGDDISLLDVRYRYGKKPDGSYGKDWIDILFKDNKTGKKKHQIIKEPDYEYYIYKEDSKLPALTHNHLFIDKDKVDKVVTPFNRLLKDIAEKTGNEQFFYNNISNGNYRANSELHTAYNVFNSDMNIEDHYRFRFGKTYKNDPIVLDKAYFDIEVDTKEMVGDFPEMGECPINAVSYICHNKITVFLLRNPENLLIEEFENSIGPSLFKQLNDFIIENVGGIKQAEKYLIDNLSYEFIFFDDELSLIKTLFDTINSDEPDVLLAWNMAFDVPYIIERCKVLGVNPSDILCHPAYKGDQRICEYFIDERHRNEYEARGDRYDISLFTVLLDQLIHFASRRKGQGAFPDFKLDTAGSIIAKVRKLDYSHITTQLSELPYLDYVTFVFYNIMDVIVQKCIEEKTKDIDYIYTKCIINNTRYEKGHRQTIYLTNRATKDFYNQGYIIGNNINRHAEKIRFKGAWVNDPRNNSDYSKVRLHNQILNLALNLLDFDYKALYPSCAIQDGMSPNTIIGKIEIDHPIFEAENPFNDDLYCRGGNYIEDLVSENTITFCSRWLHYANFMEWIKDLKYYFTHFEMPTFTLNRDRLFQQFDPRDMQKPRLFDEIDDGYKSRLFIPQPAKLDYSSYLKQIGGIPIEPISFVDKELIKLAKMLKKDIVEITPRYICGSDQELSTFAIIYLDDSIKVPSDLYYIGPVKYLTKLESFKEDLYLYQKYAERMKHLRDSCINCESKNKVLLSADNISTDQEYIIPGLIDTLNMKAKEGGNILNVDNTNLFITACSTFFSLNKKDTLSITLYENDDMSSLCKFTIHKPSHEVYSYMRFINL